MALRGIEHLATVGGELCLDFINTVHHYDQNPLLDELANFDHLLAWALKVHLVDEATHNAFRNTAWEKPIVTAHKLAQIKQIRHHIYRVFVALDHHRMPDSDALDSLLSVWKTATARARFTPGLTGGHWTYPQDPANLVSLIHPVVSNALRLLESPDLPQIRLCEAHDCSWLFMDRSKNGSRRWCQMEVCGNREKAKRYYDKIRVGGHG